MTPSDLKIQEQRAEIAKLKEYKEVLTARCLSLTLGLICVHCPVECSHRTEEFRSDLENKEK